MNSQGGMGGTEVAAPHLFIHECLNFNCVLLFSPVWLWFLQVEESAKKSIEGASNGSAIVKLYNKWHEKVEEGRTTKGSRKSLLSKIIKSKVRSTVL